MSRIRFVDENETPKPSPGSTGFARQHVAHRGSDEIAQLNNTIADMRAAMAADRSEIARLIAENEQLRSKLVARFEALPVVDETSGETETDTGETETNKKSHDEPWLAMGISKPTYYRRKKAGKL